MVWSNQTKDTSAWTNGTQDPTTFATRLKVLSYLLLQTGSFLLLESGDKIILDYNGSDSTSWTNQAES